MPTTDPNHDAGAERITSTIRAMAILFSVYIAAFVAVAGIVHVLTLHDALAAIAPASSMAPAQAAASSPRSEVAESSPSDPRGNVQERTDSSRECKPSLGIDSNCIYNGHGCLPLKAST